MGRFYRFCKGFIGFRISELRLSNFSRVQGVGVCGFLVSLGFNRVGSWGSGFGGFGIWGLGWRALSISNFGGFVA